MQSDYLQKPPEYFSGARKSFVDKLPDNPEARLLEVGTGAGDTAAYARSERKCGWCCGIELCEDPAKEANKKLDRVIIGDVEKLVLDLEYESFDILLLSEVLEHLTNPWAVIKRLHQFMKPNAILLAGVPNVCHYSVVRAILRGQWLYESKGIFDATHLRWFSPNSFRCMFESCGWVVDHVGPASPLNSKVRMVNVLTLKRFEYLLHPQIYLKAHRSEGSVTLT